MAHFAELDPQNTVLRVVVVANEECLDENGIESEAIGVAFCKQIFGNHTNWVQTSYNASIRKHYAGYGYTYDADLDVFLPPKPYPSWILNANYVWEAPIPHPNDGNKYEWDENSLSWALVTS